MTAAPARQETAVHRFPVTGQSIRSILVDGEPWFVGRDIAEALGYANTRKAVKDHVPADHRRGNESFPLTDLGFQAQTVLIDEAGMYRLILRANTGPAEQFQEWVTAEVLPAIRRLGGYGGTAKGADSIRALGRRELAEMIIAEADRADAAETRVAELAPAAEAWEGLADTEGDLGRPYVRYSKYLVERMGTWDHPSGEARLYHAVRVTPAGVEYLRRRLGGIGEDSA